MGESWRYKESFDFDDTRQLQQLVEIAEDVLPESMTPVVVNIVATVNLECEFDLFSMATKIRNAEYNPRRFNALILKIREPRATGLVFKNGKMNVVGCRTEETAELAARKFTRIVKKVGYPQIKFRSSAFEIKNMVAVIDCKFPIRLQALASDPGYRPFTKYNPEVFAGVTFRLPEPRVTLLIFASGKIVMTAARTFEMLMQASEWVHPILESFRKDAQPVDMEAVEAEVKEEPQPVKEEPVKTEVKEEVKKKRNPFKKPPKS